MIKVEVITINGREFTRTYSDEGRYVVRDDVEYSEAVDPIGSGREYTEGEISEQDVSGEEFMSMLEGVL